MTTEQPENSDDLNTRLHAQQRGFQVNQPELSELDTSEIIESLLSEEIALQNTQMISLSGGEGEIIYYPKSVNFEVGDVLYLRERDSGENGLIVQAIEKGTATYPQASSKALFRLMASVRAAQIERSHNEPPETIDEFLVLQFKVRAGINDGKWSAHEGRVVTRNVDIFRISPTLLLNNIISRLPSLNLDLGDYKMQKIEVFGGGFDKVNLVTGMKGGGKSHITKGIISENLKAGMSAVVFDINHEYDQISTNDTLVLNPGENLKFRLDYMNVSSLLGMIERLAPLSERMKYAVEAELPQQVRAYIKRGEIPDIAFLKGIDTQIVNGNNEPARNMRAAYHRSIDIIDSYGLIMSREEANTEDTFIKNEIDGKEPDLPDVISLRTAFLFMSQGQSIINVFQLGGKRSDIQKTIVTLVLEHLKETCEKQTRIYQKGDISYPVYPTVFFEEAHMYMDAKDINNLIPVIRHIGINVFFITNTPDALPDSVFRLLDNLIMTRMVNRKDIDRVADCGLMDKETIVGFAKNLQDYHALFLSAKEGATSNFPLVFKVRDFGLPKSGVTRSQWTEMKSRPQPNK